MPNVHLFISLLFVTTISHAGKSYSNLLQGLQIRQIWRILRQEFINDSKKFHWGVTLTPERNSEMFSRILFSAWKNLKNCYIRNETIKMEGPGIPATTFLCETNFVRSSFVSDVQHVAIFNCERFRSAVLLRIRTSYNNGIKCLHCTCSKWPRLQLRPRGSGVWIKHQTRLLKENSARSGKRSLRGFALTKSSKRCFVPCVRKQTEKILSQRMDALTFSIPL